ncbi:UNVERIFIED_CONTAM: hypothetical protein FKN15_003388 [Acipenser sinensis]
MLPPRFATSVVGGNRKISQVVTEKCREGLSEAVLNRYNADRPSQCSFSSSQNSYVSRVPSSGTSAAVSFFASRGAGGREAVAGEPAFTPEQAPHHTAQHRTAHAPRSPEEKSTVFISQVVTEKCREGLSEAVLNRYNADRPSQCSFSSSQNSYVSRVPSSGTSAAVSFFARPLLPIPLECKPVFHTETRGCALVFPLCYKRNSFTDL